MQIKNIDRYAVCLLVFYCFLTTENLESAPINPINYISSFYSNISGVTQRICQCFDWAACGSGGGMMDSIYEMDMAFSTIHPLTQDRAREALIYATDSYLEAINTNSLIRPFLRNFPFSVSNLCISIVSHNHTISQNDPASTLTIAFIGPGGKLKFEAGEWTKGYYSENGEWNPSYYSYEFEETYEEAKAKLAARNP